MMKATPPPLVVRYSRNWLLILAAILFGAGLRSGWFAFQICTGEYGSIDRQLFPLAVTAALAPICLAITFYLVRASRDTLAFSVDEAGNYRYRPIFFERTGTLSPGSEVMLFHRRVEIREPNQRKVEFLISRYVEYQPDRRVVIGKQSGETM